MIIAKNNKIHIAFLGRRNCGKSSIINKITGQNVSIVSEIAGTTTDAVKKSIEIPNVGAAVLIDTAGLDDFGKMGNERIKATESIVNQIDMAIIVIANNVFGKFETDTIDKLKTLDVPFFIVHNKSDSNTIYSKLKNNLQKRYNCSIVEFSATANYSNDLILNNIAKYLTSSTLSQKGLLEGIVSAKNIVLLITPIDEATPKGRLILPQVQTIRDVIDNDAIAIVCKEDEAKYLLKQKKIEPDLVITDSQIFNRVNDFVDKNIKLTSFSILLARQKGCFENYLKGAAHIDKLNDGDKILILESCAHHSTCDDIGRVKIPQWLKNYTKKHLNFEFISGLSPLPDLNSFAMLIQCGGCMITQKQLLNRVRAAIKAGIPVCNYGITIAWINGIFERVTQPFI